jgi:hypothetical protein
MLAGEFQAGPPPGEALDTHLDAGMSESAPFEWQPAECHARVVGFVGAQACTRAAGAQTRDCPSCCPRIGAWEVETLSGTASEASRLELVPLDLRLAGILTLAVCSRVLPLRWAGFTTGPGHYTTPSPTGSTRNPVSVAA